VPRTVTRILVGARRGLPSSELPVVVLSGDRPGPVAAVVANLHGDECTGIGVVHALDAHLSSTSFGGTVVLYPSGNPQGLAAQSRLVPADDADLNRAFPGNSRGSLSDRIAAALWRDLQSRRVEAVIDLHADSAHALPYVIVDRPVRSAGAVRRKLGERILRLADATGLTVLREYPDDIYVQFGLDGSLAGAVVNAMGIPAVTIEVGPRRHLSRSAVDVALAATLGSLSALGIVSSGVPAHPTRVDGVWRRASSPRARKAGVLEPIRMPGDAFERGDPLARVRALSGGVEEVVRATEPGVVVSWVEGCWVVSGGVLGTLAVRDRAVL
jgi:predicted deacylase